MNNCKSENNRYTIQNYDGVSAIDIFDMYLSFYNSDIKLNSYEEEGHILLNEINKVLEDNKDLCEISIPNPSVLFQKYVYNKLGGNFWCKS